VIVERTGYVIPYAMVGGALGAISNGLYSTFTPTTPTERWVGYQILNGIGRGVGMQMVGQTRRTSPTLRNAH
jgi:hypothetical protein